MIVDSINIYRVAMPLIYPHKTAYGSDDVIESVLVRLDSGDRHGWGEASPLKYPTYSPEWAQGVFMVAREIIAPMLGGRNIDSGAELQDRLAPIKGNQFAKAAFELAWWDLHARQNNQPLWKLIGGNGPTIDAGADFGVMDSLDDLLAAVAAAVEAGYKRIKLKYCPGWDLKMVKAVREAFPGATIHIDCNSAYSLDDLAMFEQLERYDLAMIEQPLGHDDLIDHASLQSRIGTPICLDESISSVQRARQAIQLKSCRWINIKPGRVGGLTNALAIHDLAREAGLPCWIGGMLESAVGQSFCLALASLPNIKYPSDVFPSSRFYQRDLGHPPLEHSAPSQFQLPAEPGIGVEPAQDMLKALSQDTFEAEFS